MRHARAWGGASGAEEAAARRRAFARGVARHARAEGRPERPPRRLGVAPAPDPPSRENSLSSIVRYFSCAFFGRSTRVGERRCRVITRTRRVGRRYAHHGSYLAEGLGHVVHGSVGVHHGVLQQTSRGIQRKGRFVVRLGWVVRALRGERPERDPLGAERAAGGDRARGGAAKGEHRKGKRLGRAPLRARVNAKRQTVKDPAVVARETSGTSISFMS